MAANNEREDISERLHEAIDGLRKDVTRVEIWATALASFSKPIPDYRPDPKFQLGRPAEAATPAEKAARSEAQSARHKASK